MANFLSSVLSYGQAAVDSFSTRLEPHSVVSVSSKELAPVPAVDREGCLVLYGPRVLASAALWSSVGAGDDVANAPPTYFEVVVHSEQRAGGSLSVFRHHHLDEAKRMLHLFADVLSTLFHHDPSLFTSANLQMYCDALRLKADPGYSVLHLAVDFQLKNVVFKLQLEPYLHAQDSYGRTPLMIAVQKENLILTRFLVVAAYQMLPSAIVDNLGNSVFHYAARTRCDLLDVVCDNVEAGEGVSEQIREAYSIYQGQMLNQRNNDGDTPLHVACRNDKPDCVLALIRHGADANVGGIWEDDEVPVSLESSSSSKCLNEMFRTPSQLFHLSDIKYGGTPLHWAKSKTIVEALLTDCGCRLNARNFNGATALHNMARNDRLDCLLTLIAHGANVNVTDDDGNTALHIAIENANLFCVRALLVFEADTMITNKHSQTPWILALIKVNYNSSITDVIGIGKNLKLNRLGVLYSLYAVGAFGSAEIPAVDVKGQELDFGVFQKSPSSKRSRCLFDDMLSQFASSFKKVRTGKNAKKRAKLLSLDGGGIRGLVLTRMLISMENVWKMPVIHCFDWIAGTSTGGILALALSMGKSPMECQRLYWKLKDKVFVGSRPYDTQPLDKLLQEEFGDLKLNAIKHPKVMVTATLADRTPPDLHLFRNYPSPQSVVGISDFCHPELAGSGSVGAISLPEEVLVWKAARATSAAPSFFRPDGRYVDGGIIANNPTMELLTEIVEHNIAQKAVDDCRTEVMEPEVLLSLGTGVLPVRKTTVVDIFRPDSTKDTLKLLLNWDGMGKLMLESVLDADNRVVDRCRAWCRSIDCSFFRFSPQLTTDIELDETNDKVLVDLIWNTMSYIYSRKEDVLKLKKYFIHQ